jgi:hypothetical protein
MAFDYPDFVQRVLLHDEAMRRPLPSDPENPEMVIRIREATDEVAAELRSEPVLIQLGRSADAQHSGASRATNWRVAQ